MPLSLSLAFIKQLLGHGAGTGQDAFKLLILSYLDVGLERLNVR